MTKIQEIQKATYAEMLDCLDKHGMCNVVRPTGFGFLASNCFPILRMRQNDIAAWLQNVVNGNPILSGGFHAHIFAVVLRKPICAPAQITSEGGEPFAFVGGHSLLIGGGNTGVDKGFVNVHPTAATVNDFEHNTFPQNSI